MSAETIILNLGILAVVFALWYVFWRIRDWYVERRRLNDLLIGRFIQDGRYPPHFRREEFDVGKARSRDDA